LVFEPRLLFQRGKSEVNMTREDWAKKYAAMDRRLMLKYAQLPRGEQIGKNAPAKKPEANDRNGQNNRAALQRR